MHTLLTGGTGTIGSAVLRHLVAADHEVTALVRSAEAAGAVAFAGASPLLGDIANTPWLTDKLRDFDGAIHAATPGDATSEQFDRSMVAAVRDAFEGTDRTYLHTGGIWVYGSGAGIVEDSPLDPPALVGWRPPVEELLLRSGVQATVVVPGIVYGYGRGIPSLLSGDAGGGDALHLIGDGSQHWPTVHVDDLAALYVIALERREGLGRVLVVNEDQPTVAELTAAVAGDRGIVASTPDETRSRLGAAFADALLLDQRASADKARSLGWWTEWPSLLEELRDGSYATVGA